MQVTLPLAFITFIRHSKPDVFLVGGVGNTLGDTTKGATDTVGNTAKGAGGAVSDTTSGLGDTAKGATGGKQDAQNPLGL